MNSGQVLPFLATSYGVLINNDTEWSLSNDQAVPMPVIGKKAYFSTPCNVLPDNGNPYGSVWKQHLGQITYFTPGDDISPVWVTTSIQFFTNFIAQNVKVVINNSANEDIIVMSDWTPISYVYGSFQPKLEYTKYVTKLTSGVNYWVEVWFDQTVNKAPTMYSENSTEGFLAKYWWSINEADESSIIPTSPTGTDSPTGTYVPTGIV